MLGERLQELRKDKNMTQQDLAEILLVSFHTISSYERNRSVPNDEIKVKIAHIFDVSLDYLLGLIREPFSFERNKNTIILPELPDEAIKEITQFIEFVKSKHKK